MQGLETPRAFRCEAIYTYEDGKLGLMGLLRFTPTGVRHLLAEVYAGLARSFCRYLRL